MLIKGSWQDKKSKLTSEMVAKKKANKLQKTRATEVSKFKFWNFVLKA